jgi:DNA polymerase-3 subunit epsilon
MKKSSVILWFLSILFLIGSVSLCGQDTFGGAAFCLVLSTICGFLGYLKFTNRKAEYKGARIKKSVVILWCFAAFFLAVSIDLIGSNLSSAIVGTVLATILGFIGYRNFAKEKVKVNKMADHTISEVQEDTDAEIAQKEVANRHETKVSVSSFTHETTDDTNRHNIPELHTVGIQHSEQMLDRSRRMDFIAIDFETATPSTNSACSLGIACVSDLEIVHTEYYLIQPPSLLFSKKNIEIHGILPKDVKDSPLFPEVWNAISHYFDGSCPVFAHNAQFDMSVLMESFAHYGIKAPIFNYCCSIPFSSKICSGGVSRSLESRADFFGIQMPDHHNAKADAITCAQIVIETVHRSRQKTFKSFCNIRSIPFHSFSTLKSTKTIGKMRFNQIDYKNVVATNDIPENSVFSGKIVVITGEFSAYSRRDLTQALINMGAIIKDNVTKKTDYLVVGTQDKSVVGEDGLSGKQEKAITFQSEGIAIKIIDEKTICDILTNCSMS